MRNAQWQKLLDSTAKAHAEYLHLLNLAEAEYERRFGASPADVDDDYWIDSFHQTTSGASVENVIKYARFRVKPNKEK